METENKMSQEAVVEKINPENTVTKETHVMKDMKNEREELSAKITRDSMSIVNLTSAIKEHEVLLCRRVVEPIYAYFINLYDKSRKQAKIELSDSMDQVDLDLIILQDNIMPMKQWNTVQINEIVENINSVLPKRFSLEKTLKMLFAAKSMLYSSLGDTSNEYIQVQIPTIDEYVYRVLLLVAKFVFGHPSILRRSSREKDSSTIKRERVLRRHIKESIIDAITDLLPVDSLMDTYLSKTIKSAEQRGSTGPVETKRDDTNDDVDFGFSDASDDESSDEDGVSCESDEDDVSCESESDEESELEEVKLEPVVEEAKVEPVVEEVKPEPVVVEVKPKEKKKHHHKKKHVKEITIEK